MTLTPSCIVAIGASAGSHPAMEALFRNVEPDLDVSYILAQHLSPDHDSILPEIIASFAPLPAVAIEDRMRIQPRIVYIVPPGKTAHIRNQTIFLEQRTGETHISNVVDTLFRSLSEAMGRQCIGIVLSGAGSDGSSGIRLIKEAGGLTIAQDSDSAAFSSMPDMARQSTEIDLVLQPESMGAAIGRYVELIRDSEDLDEDLERILDRVTNMIQDQGGPAFSHYKKATLKRRLEKRLSVHSCTIDEYLSRLERDPEELRALHRDFLIGVTEFFRDSEVFAKLESDILPGLIQRGPTLRLWSIGCSTGEEVYSLAISVKESLRKLGLQRDVQIFATDLDSRALDVAREGSYLASAIQNMDRDRLNRYFIVQGQNLQIHKEIRDLVIFAEHDILKDPPYSRIDLIACRNLLIYLNRDSQKRVLASIHYSLSPEGVAVLGKSESLGDLTGHFRDIDRARRIYAKRTDSSGEMMHLFSRPRHDPRAPALPSRTIGIQERAREAILHRFTPPSVIVNDRNRIVFVQGRTSRWLEIPTGEATNDLLNMVRTDLKVPLANLLRLCRNQSEEVQIKNVRITDLLGNAVVLDLIASPLPEFGESEGHMTIVAFLEQAQSSQIEDSHRAALSTGELSRELEQTRTYLESTVEQLEATNEELRASNEEGQAINEELQSANEELETSREELQSLNEELMTTNAELQHKVEALAKANNDIYNLMRSSQIASLFLDKEFRVTWFSPALTNIVDLIDGDIGRPIRQFRTSLLDTDLVEQAAQVLSGLIPIEKAIDTADNRYLWMRILPYRTLEDSILGVVITFIDITEKRKQERELEQYRENLEQLVQERSADLARSQEFLNRTGSLARVGGWEYNLETSEIRWTDTMRELFEVGPDFTPTLDNASFAIVGEAREQVDNALSHAIARGVPYDLLIPFKTFRGNARWMRAVGQPVFENGRCVKVYGLLKDATERVEAERQREHSMQMLAKTEEITHVGSWEWDIVADKVHWSAELFRIFGLDPAEGEPAFSEHARLYPPEDLARLQAAVEKSRDEGVSYDLELTAMRSDGTRFDCRARGLARSDPSGKVTHLYGSLQDISEQKSQQRDLLESREQAERASQAKTVFLGSLSHELRTPMNAIIGMTDLAMEQTLPKEAREYLQVSRDASDHLLEIIKDLLDSAVMEQGRIRLLSGPFSLKRAILRSISMARLSAEAKKLSIRCTIDDRIPELLTGDSKRISQIVTNLLDNAIRQTQKGEVKVLAEVLEPTAKDGGDQECCTLSIAVTDTGEGIAPQDQARIFDKFVQVRENDNRLVRQNQGTGLGLHIVKSLVEAMGGEVTLISQPNQGAEFRIVLSLPVAQEEATKAAPIYSSKRVQGDLRILMAEDNAINAIVQRTVLEQARHTVTIVEDGREVLEKLAKRDFDLILLDLEMPIMDGFETSERIRAGEAGEANRSIPIVAITAHVLDEIKDHCQRSGMDGFITKPIDANALNQTLDNIISSRKI